MDGTLGEIIAYGAVCITAGVALSAIAGVLLSERRANKIAPVLDRQYGPKIKENLTRLEEAVWNRDKRTAQNLVTERMAILEELRTINTDYAWRFLDAYFGHASDTVRTDLTKGAELEDKLALDNK